MNFSVHQASCIGDRKYNQDRAAYAYTEQALLLVLADGMGGHLHGEQAATLAIETFTESFAQTAQPRIASPERFITDAMIHAHRRIMRLPGDANHGLPGTTCVVALIQDGQVYYGHAGDSRLYLLRDGALVLKTHDHSLVQQWLDIGLIDAADAHGHPQRNQITNCLGGIDDAFRVEPVRTEALRSGDVLLLGSDGLWGPFGDDELAEAFAVRPVADVLEDMIVSARDREDGHSDNITGLALRWGENEPAHDTDGTVSLLLDIH